MQKPDLEALATQAEQRKLPPIEQWNPPLSGTMDLRITRDGSWIHEGRPIQRLELVRLFSTILRREDDGEYYLLTPVEKWRIQVDDAPFTAPLLEVDNAGKADQQLRFTTNVGDRVVAGPDHPIEVEYATPDSPPAPYVQVRGRLRALIGRSVFLELAELGEQREVDGETCYGVRSQGMFFSLGRLDG